MDCLIELKGVPFIRHLLNLGDYGVVLWTMFKVQYSVHKMLIGIFKNGSPFHNLHRPILMLVCLSYFGLSFFIFSPLFCKWHFKLEETFLHCLSPGWSFKKLQLSTCLGLCSGFFFYRHLCSIVRVFFPLALDIWTSSIRMACSSQCKCICFKRGHILGISALLNRFSL